MSTDDDKSVDTGRRKMTDAELADPVYMQAYVDACHDSYNECMIELAKLRKAVARTAREARNQMTIDGHLNDALDAVMTSTSPDGTFCILGSVAYKAIELVGLRAPTSTYSTNDWWYQELMAVYNGSKDTTITLNMKRAAGIAMKVAQGKVYDEYYGWDYPAVHAQAHEDALKKKKLV